MWKKAFLDTHSYFGWNKKTIIPPLVVWVVGAIFYWKWAGWEAVMEEIAVIVAFVIAPILLYFLCVYIFN